MDSTEPLKQYENPNTPPSQEGGAGAPPDDESPTTDHDDDDKSDSDDGDSKDEHDDRTEEERAARFVDRGVYEGTTLNRHLANNVLLKSTRGEDLGLIW